ncbi:glycosyltransferase family 4 protein [Clostridium novyi]
MIIQYGPYPPPYGGISIYIKRMKLYLDSNDIKSEVWNSEERTNKINRVKLKYIPLKIIFNRDVKLIHFNITGVLSKIYVGILAKIFRKKRFVITIHGQVENLFMNTSFLKSFLMIRALNNFDAIICVKNGDKNYLMSKGVISKIYELPAYLDPIEDPDDFNKIPEKVWRFIDDNSNIICANGAIRFKDKKDLYGIDMLIELVNKLKNNYNNIKLIFCLLSFNARDEQQYKYYLKIKEQIRKYKLQNNIYLFKVKNTELYPILKKSNLFIRPTYTDGYGVSIAEAIYYNVPSIASNVCDRPEGTVLFKNRDFEDLYRKTEYVINNLQKEKEKLKNIKIQDNSQSILQIYRNLLMGGE